MEFNGLVQAHITLINIDMIGTSIRFQTLPQESSIDFTNVEMLNNPDGDQMNLCPSVAESQTSKRSLIPLKPQDQEYEDVKQKFERSMMGYCISQISRFDHSCLDAAQQQKNGKDVSISEQKLFVGSINDRGFSEEEINEITQNGFSDKYCREGESFDG